MACGPILEDSLRRPKHASECSTSRAGNSQNITQRTMSWELWKHPDLVPGGRPIFFKPEWPKESKNGFKTISYRRYRMGIFSNYFFRRQKTSKKLDGITSNKFPNNFYALKYSIDNFVWYWDYLNPESYKIVSRTFWVIAILALGLKFLKMSEIKPLKSTMGVTRGKP